MGDNLLPIRSLTSLIVMHSLIDVAYLWRVTQVRESRSVATSQQLRARNKNNNNDEHQFQMWISNDKISIKMLILLTNESSNELLTNQLLFKL